MNTKIGPGDRVAFSSRFLRATGMHSGWGAHVRGTVVHCADEPLILIQWDGAEGVPGRRSYANRANLVREDQIAVEAALADGRGGK